MKFVWMKELINKGFSVERQRELPVVYKGKEIKMGFKLDLIVEDSIILELKCVDKLIPIHTAQLMTYLKLSDIKLGLLLNFNVKSMKNGIKRVIM